MKQITDWNTVEFNREYLVKEAENWYIARLNVVRTSKSEYGTATYYDWEDVSEHFPVDPDFVFELPNTDLLTKTGGGNEVD